MDDDAEKENPPADFNKIDLSQLQGFSFGTQWTQDKTTTPGGRDSGDRPRREDRRDSYPGALPNRKDRRSFQRPAGGPGAGEGADERGEFRGGQRRPVAGPGDDSQGRRRNLQRDQGPYVSPYFSVTFYPEDASFTALAKTIRASCRTIELFEIARTVLAKPERFTVVVARRPPAGEGGEANPARAETAPAAPKAAPFHISVPDSVPFESEDAAVAHFMSRHLDLFFTRAEVEVEPPKGNIQVVNRCTVTGELLGPPNYHRYAEIVQRHHAERIPRMSLEAYRSRIESVRDPEAIKQWLEKIRKVTRYTWREAAAAIPPAPAPQPEAGVPSEAAAPDGSAPAAPQPAEQPSPEAKEVAVAASFDSLEEARNHLLAQARDKVVRATATARFHGRALESLPDGEIRRAVEGEWERQCRFPLDTANALRGRLRREHFTIFKKGSKGISYVCAVKRKFRVPGQAFAENIGSLIAFIENNPLVKASGLVEKFLGFASQAPAEAGAETGAPALTAEQREKIARLQADLRWLVHEGYVTEFIDGTLYAPPPVVEARKREIEAEEQDPENFPERPNPSPSAEDSPPPASAGAEDRPSEPPAPESVQTEVPPPEV